MQVLVQDRHQQTYLGLWIRITKTEVGFNIYSNQGILILEFTKQNCDSTSLETLDYIYETVKGFYDMEFPKEEKRIQSIKGT